jgi:hypothetical protein
MGMVIVTGIGMGIRRGVGIGTEVGIGLLSSTCSLWGWSRNLSNLACREDSGVEQRVLNCCRQFVEVRFPC